MRKTTICVDLPIIDLLSKSGNKQIFVDQHLNILIINNPFRNRHRILKLKYRIKNNKPKLDLS